MRASLFIRVALLTAARGGKSSTGARYSSSSGSVLLLCLPFAWVLGSGLRGSGALASDWPIGGAVVGCLGLGSELVALSGVGVGAGATACAVVGFLGLASELVPLSGVGLGAGPAAGSGLELVTLS